MARTRPAEPTPAPPSFLDSAGVAAMADELAAQAKACPDKLAIGLKFHSRLLDTCLPPDAMLD